ncbi:glycosyltransferase [Photobacterium leiognathi]|uniref:glycosyltransferase n=1 Tax=Photobacterium leiognathi TaxID=553611 RepID=UPI0029817637|nr:glycosyltransferase [Photobacterium leiognathi]
MKRILFVTHNLKGGGIQKITLDTARYHALQGHDVSILALEKGIDFQIDFPCNYSVLPLSSFLLTHPFSALYFALYKVILRHIFPQSELLWGATLYKNLFNSYLKNQQPFDAIFINGARSMNRLHTINQKNVVYSLHLPHVLTHKDDFYYDYLFKKLFTGKKVFTVSDFIRNPIDIKAKKLGVNFNELITIYNPCDKNALLEKAEEQISFNDNFILAVGRLSRQKRFDILIDAYKKSGLKTKLIILGEGNQRESLEHQIQKLNLTEDVILKGFDSNPFKWMKRCDYFVLSSDVEGFVLVINEALACGAPVITTDCGPVTEILTGELKKGIVPKQNVEQLTNKMKEFAISPIYPPNSAIDKLSFKVITKEQLKLAEK